MRKLFFVASCSLLILCFSVSSRLADASYEKPAPPLPQPEKRAAQKLREVKYQFNARRLTGYYKARPKQKRYARGSYQKDIRLNGSGKRTKSGKIPVIGMAAANWRHLPQGTRFRIIGCKVLLQKNPDVHVSDLIFTVEDTGALKKGEIDLFCGAGMKGLETAEKINDRQHDDFVIEVLK